MPDRQHSSYNTYIIDQAPACIIMVLVPTELLERVFLRLGAAESDDQLEKLLGRFLIPVILKVTSEHKTVQNKVSLLS